MTDSLEQGLALRAERKLKAAVAAFERAVDEDPSSWEAWFWLAATLDNRGDEAHAIHAYEEALRLGLGAENRVKALTWLASSHSKVGNHQAAMSSLADAEAAGGYAPREEFRRIAKSVRRRSAPKASAEG